jgi:hypothetical protein
MLRAKEIPKLVWIVLPLAVVAGLWSYLKNPYGSFWYSDAYPCSQRSHTFTDLYQLVLVAAIAIVLLRPLPGHPLN